MTWLAPLGFLGLIGIIALIIIYFIRPNYQRKMVSSTFVWKLSLKYRKRRIPISRLNNLLIFLCQLLILTICGLLLARPVIEHEKVGDENEKILIIDASASMRTVDKDGVSRFERAISEARETARVTLEDGGLVSIIVADDNPAYLVQRSSSENIDDVLAAVDSLIEGEDRCTYSSANVESAVGLTEEVLAYNPEAQIFYYTGTKYIEKNGINVVDISDSEEWNAAILGCTAEKNISNHLEISVNVGCYNRTDAITVYIEIYGAKYGTHSSGEKITVEQSEYFDPTEEEKVIVFNDEDFLGQGIYSYDYIQAYVAVDDSFSDDNSFFLYGGTKPTIRIQYASSRPNNYFGGAVRTLKQMLGNQWNIEYVQLKADQTAATEGFDLYIFEHRMPTEMPTDGVVLLVNPSGAPEGAGISFGSAEQTPSSGTTLASGVPHELTKFVESSKITIARYTTVNAADGYAELAYYNGQPVILAKNEPDSKVVVWAFDLNYSNLGLLPEFPFLIYNMFNYYIPSSFNSYSYEIGDVVDLSARGNDFKVEGNGLEYIMQDKTGSITVTRPGTYTVTQMPMSGKELIIENFYVRIPVDESNLTRQVDMLPATDVDVETRTEFEDLMFYFAIALVSLLFVEWILQIKKNF